MTRRLLFVRLAAVLCLLLVTSAGAADWPTATPVEVGLAADLGPRIDAAVDAGRLPYVHGIVVVRQGKLVLERYYRGDDVRFAEHLGVVDYDAARVHSIHSITKSVVSLLYGIALVDGKVPPPEASLYAQFPEFADLALPERRGITAEHALAMTTGLAWDERQSYGSFANTATAMWRSPDMIRAALDRPVTAAPGEAWDYNSGSTEVLGALIARGSGQPVDVFARTRLFAPLGIDSYDWVMLPDGRPMASGGLRLTPRDLAKIGQLVLNKGEWDGKQVVPADWIARSTTPHARTRYWTGSGVAYGYQWWLGNTWANGLPYIAGVGYGGQRLFILPSADLVLVVTAGGYRKSDSHVAGATLLNDLVLPALAGP